MKICCVFSLELPQWGNSNEYTHYIIFIIKTIMQNYPKSAAMGVCSKGLNKEFETTEGLLYMVNALVQPM